MPWLSRSFSIRVIIVAACCVGAWGYLLHASEAEVIPQNRLPLAVLPMDLDGREGFNQKRFEPEVEAELGVDEYIVRDYVREGALPVSLYVGYHDSQRQGDTIHSPMNCLPGSGWEPLETSRRVVRVTGAPGTDGESAVELNRVVIGKGLQRHLVYYWYQSHRRVVASEYSGKVYTVLDAIRHNRTDAALVRVIVPMPEDAPPGLDADQTAIAFIQQLFPPLADHFPA